MVQRFRRFDRRATIALVLSILTVAVASCAVSKGDVLNPEQARDALVSTIEATPSVLDVAEWSWTGAPEVGNCGARRGEAADYTYGFSAPPQPDRDHAADAEKVAEYWSSLGLQVRVVESPSYVVYATGGPVKGLSFSTAPGNYYITGTSLCVPGDADELRKQDNG